jgi:hypothetical protein|tara:strand:+ start:1572 stop:1958 length:387 start_codon:yes stop_codon:yes gene_type:complete
MGKKAAHSGESPKDRSINKMDKFIRRNERRNERSEVLPARRKDPSVPFHMWPLKDQIEYAENRTDADRFDDNFPAYSYWIMAVQKKSGIHYRTFSDFTNKLKPELQKLYDSKSSVGDAVEFLRRNGKY